MDGIQYSLDTVAGTAILFGGELTVVGAASYALTRATVGEYLGSKAADVAEYITGQNQNNGHH